MTLTHKTAVVAGASGFVGRRIAAHLIERGGWDVIGLARRPRPAERITWIALDLSDRADCMRKLSGLDRVTHVFYAARDDHPQEGRPEALDSNGSMLANVVDTLDRVAPLEHVHAVHGSKYYGHQLGPVPVPMREESPRAGGSNFYFLQEDFLRERSRASRWSYSTSRPHSFCDDSIDVPRSLGLVIAVYAAIRRELGLPLDFPGGAVTYGARTQFTDVGLLARAIAWMATEPRCANQSFNIVNGDHLRWSDLWPRFAAWFGMEPRVAGKFSLAEYMLDKREIWSRIVQKHSLRAVPLDAIVLWPYGDYQLAPEWDIVSSMDKARALGFRDTIESVAMFMRQFETYRRSRVIP